MTEKKTKMQQRSVQVFNIFTGYLTKFSRELPIPSLPAIAVSFGVSVSLVQLTVGVYFIGMGISRLVLAPLSDLVGRRQVIGLSAILFGLGSLMAWVSPDIEVLILGRFVQGLGLGCLPPVARALIRDTHDDTQTRKVLAYLAIAITWAPAVAMGLGGVLQDWVGWRIHFLVLTGLGGALFGVSRWIPDPKQADFHFHQFKDLLSRIMRQYIGLIRQPELRATVLAGAAVMAGIAAYLTVSSPLLMSFGLSASQFGFLHVVFVGAMVAGSVTSGRLNQVSGKRLMMGGLILACLSSLGLGLLAWTGLITLWTLIGVIGVYFYAAGVVEPLFRAYVLNLAPHLAGTASAVLGVTQANLSGGVSFLVAQFKPDDLGSFSSVLACLTVGALIYFLKHQRGGST